VVTADFPGLCNATTKRRPFTTRKIVEQGCKYLDPSSMKLTQMGTAVFQKNSYHLDYQIYVPARNDFCFNPTVGTPSEICDMSNTKIIKAMLVPLVAVAAMALSTAARAVPMDYSVVYNGTSIGPASTGSFSWDPETSAFSNFTWNFSSTADTLMANNWRTSIFGGTMGQFLFEILTGEDVHPAGCSAGARCSFSSANIRSSLLTSVEFRTLSPGMSEYLFRNGASVLFSGTLSVTRVLAVSEPLTVCLIGIGLLGLSLRRRKSLV
jgi:hypothetical protein